MKLLVIGSGGREHAIAKTLKQSPTVSTVFCAKGNPRMEQDGIITVNLSETDGKAIVEFAQAHQIDWVFVGPEIPLFYGVSDALEQAGIPVFSPSQAAAKLEYSKDFAKQIMQKYGVPTAKSATFTDFEQAKAYVLEQGAPIVIKADGLAAGKGVIVAMSEAEAVSALEMMLVDELYVNQDDQARVVIEEFLEGEEFSLFSFVNGDKAWFAGISQDHKRAYDGDQGPNTGGMGAYSPVPQFGQDVIDEAMKIVVQPTIEGLVKEGTPYKGVLYAGLMMTKDGIKVIEFNARFGDPETQVVLQRFESDFAQHITDILNGKDPQIKWKTNGITLGVVVAAEGYPAKAKSGFELGELSVPANSSLQLFGAGIAKQGDKFIANGGRLFLVSATADSVKQAQQQVYAYLANHPISHTFYRKDIGFRAK